MTIELDGRLMTDRAATHDQLLQRLGLPEYYGRNLDALYDLLTEVSSPICIRFIFTDEMRAQLGSYGAALLVTLRQAEENNPTLTLELL